MEPLALLLRGWLLGLSLAAPVGPIAVLCIRRTLVRGVPDGLVTGFASAGVDAFYAAITGSGLVLIADQLLRHQGMLRALAGLLLCGLGLRTLLAAGGPVRALLPIAPPGERQNRPLARGPRLLATWGSTVLVALANPFTILFFLALMPALTSAGLPLGGLEVALLCGGIFTGSCSWWLALSLGVDRLRCWLDGTLLRWLNAFAGLLLIGFGLAGLGSLVMRG
ncbi:LysE family translocator [Cyanobium sp. FGCU-52]|nr:LysE family translocator [Cyanobium sp. FGCU52]